MDSRRGLAFDYHSDPYVRRRAAGGGAGPPASSFALSHSTPVLSSGLSYYTVESLEGSLVSGQTPLTPAVGGPYAPALGLGLLDSRPKIPQNPVIPAALERERSLGDRAAVGLGLDRHRAALFPHERNPDLPSADRLLPYQSGLHHFQSRGLQGGPRGLRDLALVEPGKGDGRKSQFRVDQQLTRVSNGAIQKLAIWPPKQKADNRKKKKDFYCSVCKINCGNSHNLTHHLRGKRHLQNLEEGSKKKDANEKNVKGEKGDTNKKADSEEPMLKAETQGNDEGEEVSEDEEADNQDEEEDEDQQNDKQESKEDKQESKEDKQEGQPDKTDMATKFDAEGEKRVETGDASALVGKKRPEPAITDGGNDSKRVKVEESVGHNEAHQQNSYISCDICKISCSGKKNFEMHVKGKKHRKALEKEAK